MKQASGRTKPHPQRRGRSAAGPDRWQRRWRRPGQPVEAPSRGCRSRRKGRCDAASAVQRLPLRTSLRLQVYGGDRTPTLGDRTLDVPSTRRLPFPLRSLRTATIVPQGTSALHECAVAACSFPPEACEPHARVAMPPDPPPRRSRRSRLSSGYASRPREHRAHRASAKRGPSNSPRQSPTVISRGALPRAAVHRCAAAGVLVVRHHLWSFPVPGSAASATVGCYGDDGPPSCARIVASTRRKCVEVSSSARSPSPAR